jgi:hypothetical protein
MTQTRRLSKHNTRVVQAEAWAGEGMEVIFHDTTIIRKIGRTITLWTDGWQTATTKLRMNQFANEYCGGAFQVFQDKGEWYVRRRANKLERDSWLTEDFMEGMEFTI